MYRNILLLPVFLLIGSSAVFSLGLYETRDPLYILTASNFHISLLNRETAWIIEFYNSYCGHCISFAPVWKEFADDVKGWNHTIKVGVIDCANTNNTGICREYEVMGYPTVRLFRSNVKKGFVGQDMTYRTVDTMRKAVIDFVVEQQEKGNGSKSWVDLQSYEGNLKNVLDSSDKSVAAVIMEDKDSYLGKEVILDVGKNNKIHIRRRILNTEEIAKYKIEESRAVAFVKGSVVSVKSTKAKTRHKLIQFIKRLAEVQNFRNVHNSMGDENEMEGAGDGGLENDTKNEETKINENPNSFFKSHDQVYMVDIENAISYAIRHEIALHKVIEGEKLDALRSFLEALTKYLPARPELKRYLQQLLKYVKYQNSITGDDYETVVASFNTTDSILPGQQEWIRCKGSSPTKRGYTCGLWTLFHTMTVHSADFHNGDTVLQSIHGYVKHFFGCTHCSTHFQEMYKEDQGDNAWTRDDSILWLWKAHNKVNKRIKGDITEDPAHPKVIYPTQDMCSKCWVGEELDQNAVLDYLKGLYSEYNISNKGTVSLAPHVHNKQAKVFNALHDHKFSQNNNDIADVYSSQNNSASSALSFNTTDMRMCIILYGLSTLIVFSVYFLVVIRRKRRRQKFIQAHKNAGELEDVE